MVIYPSLKAELPQLFILALSLPGLSLRSDGNPVRDQQSRRSFSMAVYTCVLLRIAVYTCVYLCIGMLAVYDNAL